MWDGSKKGEKLEKSWIDLFNNYSKRYPDLAEEFNRRINRNLPENWEEISKNAINEINHQAIDLATRQSSHLSLNKLGDSLPEMIGGSADLTGSNLTKHDASVVIDETNSDGNYIYYGVREFGMAAIGNGMILHGGVIPYSGTFLTFSDYSRNALRMAALMKIQNIFVFTHDSIGLGEDGPTHQPIEHVSNLRIMPNMNVWRPCDAVETITSWCNAIENQSGPTSLILTRQKLNHQLRTEEQVQAIKKGGYILKDSKNTPEIILIATGSEVLVAMESAKMLDSDGIDVRVVSMPCNNIFNQQPESYRSAVLPKSVKSRLAIEAGITNFWWQYVGSEGDVIGIDEFGLSAPANELFEYFGFTVKNITERARSLIEKNS